MAMSKDEAVATLKAMFDEWDMLSLADAVATVSPMIIRYTKAAAEGPLRYHNWTRTR